VDQAPESPIPDLTFISDNFAIDSQESSTDSPGLVTQVPVWPQANDSVSFCWESGAGPRIESTKDMWFVDVTTRVPTCRDADTCSPYPGARANIGP